MLVQPINVLFLFPLTYRAWMTGIALVRLAYVLSLSTNIIETSFLSRAFDIADLARQVLDDATQGALRLSNDQFCTSHSQLLHSRATSAKKSCYI
jgi:hypothetical protein